MSFSKELLLAALRGHTDKPIDPIGKELREDLKECEPKPAGPGGGVSSWNDIPDRPFGVEYGDTASADQITDPATLDPTLLVAGQFLKVNDTPVTMDDLSGGFTLRFGEEEMTIPPAEVGDQVFCPMDGIIMMLDVIISVSEQAAGIDIGDGFTFPEGGLYIAAPMLFDFDFALTIPGFGKFAAVKKLDALYIPAGYKNVLQVQSDWKETNEASLAYIKNKPSVTKVLTTKVINNVAYLCEDKNSDPITRNDLYFMVKDYGPANVMVDKSMTCWVSAYAGDYGILEYYTTNTSTTPYSKHTQRAFTAEYTPT